MRAPEPERGRTARSAAAPPYRVVASPGATFRECGRERAREKSAQASIRQRSAAFVALFAHAQRFRQPPPGPETAGAPRTDPGLVRRPVANCPRRAAEARRGHARARRQNTPATLLKRGPRRVQRSNGHGGQRMAAGNARHARPRGLDLARPLQRIRTRPAPPRGAPCRESAPRPVPYRGVAGPMWSVSKRFRPI